MPLLPTDIVALVILAAFLLIGLFRGFIEEGFRLLAIVGGFAIAFVFSKAAAAQLHVSWLQGTTKQAAVFLGIYLGSALIIFLIGWIIKKVLHFTPMGMIDRLAGGIFGAVKACCIIWIIFIIIGVLPLQQIQTMVHRSYTYAIIKKFTPAPVKNLKAPENPITSNINNARHLMTQLKKTVDSTAQREVPNSK